MSVKLWRLKANRTPDKQPPALRISILSAQVKCECLLSQVSHCITDFTRLRLDVFIWVWGKEGNVRWPWSIIHQTNKGRIHFKKAASCLIFTIFPPCGQHLVHKIENTFAFWKQLYICIKHQALFTSQDQGRNDSSRCDTYEQVYSSTFTLTEPEPLQYFFLHNFQSCWCRNAPYSFTALHLNRWRLLPHFHLSIKHVISSISFLQASRTETPNFHIRMNYAFKWSRPEASAEERVQQDHQSAHHSESLLSLLWESHWSNPIKHTILPADLFNRVHQDTAGHLSLSTFVFLEGIYIYLLRGRSSLYRELHAPVPAETDGPGHGHGVSLHAEGWQHYNRYIQCIIQGPLAVHCTRKHLWGMQSFS